MEDETQLEDQLSETNFQLDIARELNHDMAKALTDALHLLPPGGSVRATVVKALEKYNGLY